MEYGGLWECWILVGLLEIILLRNLATSYLILGRIKKAVISEADVRPFSLQDYKRELADKKCLLLSQTFKIFDLH